MRKYLSVRGPDGIVHLVHLVHSDSEDHSPGSPLEFYEGCITRQNVDGTVVDGNIVLTTCLLCLGDTRNQ